MPKTNIEPTQVRARDAEAITGMGQSEQRAKRARGQISPLEPGRRAWLTAFDIGEMAFVAELARFHLNVAKLQDVHRRQAARMIGHAALLARPNYSGGLVSPQEALALSNDYEAMDDPEIYSHFIIWPGKVSRFFTPEDGFSTLALFDIPPFKLWTAGTCLVFNIAEMGQKIARKFPGDLVRRIEGGR